MNSVPLQVKPSAEKTLSWVPQPQFKHRADDNAAGNSALAPRASVGDVNPNLMGSAVTPLHSFKPLGGAAAASSLSSRALTMKDMQIWCGTDGEDENSLTTPSLHDAVAAGKLSNSKLFTQHIASTRSNKLYESFATSEGTLGCTDSTQLLSTMASNSTEECDSPPTTSVNHAISTPVPTVAPAAHTTVAAPTNNTHACLAAADSSAVCRVRSLPSKTSLFMAGATAAAPTSRATEARVPSTATTTTNGHSLAASQPSATPSVASVKSLASLAGEEPDKTSPPHLHCLSDTAESLAVVDPQRRKLLIPRSALSPTKGLLGRRSAPSLCLLYQNGRCHQGNNCYQVHADPDVVQQLRSEAESRPCCCALHEDCNRSQWNPEKLSETVQGVTINTIGTRIPLNRFAFTVGLEKLVQTNVGDPRGVSPSDYGVTLGNRIVLTANRDSVCRLHGADGGCRFGGDCKFIHVCRQLLAFAEATAQVEAQQQKQQLPSPMQTMKSPMVNQPFAMPGFQPAICGTGMQPAYTLQTMVPAPVPNAAGYSLCRSIPAQAAMDRARYGAVPPAALNVSALQSPSHPHVNQPSTTSPGYFLTPNFAQPQPFPMQQVMYVQQYDPSTGGMRIVPVSVMQSP